MKRFYYDGYGNTADYDVRDLFADSSGSFLGYGQFTSSKFHEMIKREHLDIAELFYLGRISYVAIAALHLLGDCNIRYGNQETLFDEGDENLWFDENNPKKWFKEQWYDIINNYDGKDKGFYPHKHYEYEYKHPEFYKKNIGKAHSYELDKYPEVKQLLLDWVNGKIRNKNFVKPGKNLLPSGKEMLWWSGYEVEEWGNALVDKDYMINFAKMEMSRIKKVKKNHDWDIEQLKDFISKLKKK